MLQSTPIRKAGAVLAFLCFGVFVVVALFGPNGVPALLAQRAKVNEMARQNAELTKERDDLRYRVKALENDAQTLELEARTKLGVAKKDETIVKVDQPGKEAPKPQTTQPALPPDEQ